jgi:hypothetical protein
MSSMIQRPRPKLELALPYGSYRLTRADGAPLERTDKHPFCMSRRACAAARARPRPSDAGAISILPANSEAKCGRYLSTRYLLYRTAILTAGCTTMRLRDLRRPGRRHLMGPAAGGRPAPRSRSSPSGWVHIICSDLYALASFTHSAALIPQVMVP